MLVVEKPYGSTDSVNNEKASLFKNFLPSADLVKDHLPKRNTSAFNLHKYNQTSFYLSIGEVRKTFHTESTVFVNTDFCICLF